MRIKVVIYKLVATQITALHLNATKPIMLDWKADRLRKSSALWRITRNDKLQKYK